MPARATATKAAPLPGDRSPVFPARAPGMFDLGGGDSPAVRAVEELQALVGSRYAGYVQAYDKTWRVDIVRPLEDGVDRYSAKTLRKALRLALEAVTEVHP